MHLEVWNLLNCNELAMLIRIGARIPGIDDRRNRMSAARDQIRREVQLERMARFSMARPSIRKAIRDEREKQKVEAAKHQARPIRKHRVPRHIPSALIGQAA